MPRKGIYYNSVMLLLALSIFQSIGNVEIPQPQHEKTFGS